ncbi:MAG: hypothetical protein IH870_00985, partial [Chloroflexi bacterium]|nr:hypothetical protein [Chloroflexota bacterium]
MSEHLQSTKLRLKRADHHLKELDRKIGDFIDRKPYRMTRQINPQQTHYIYRTQLHRQPPATWSVIVGDIIHNLRSALDNMVYSLCTRPSRDTAFPLFANANVGTFNRMTAHVPENAITDIKALQPYNYGEELAARHPLTALRVLSNADKHKTIHLSYISPQFPLIGTNGQVAYVRTLQDGSVEFSLPID